MKATATGGLKRREPAASFDLAVIREDGGVVTGEVGEVGVSTSQILRPGLLSLLDAVDTEWRGVRCIEGLSVALL